MAGNLVESLIGAAVLVVAIGFLAMAYSRTDAGAVSGYFLSVVTYQLAFLLASDASLVSLSSSLAPLGIVVVRLLGLLRPRPTRSEIAGTCIGLLGACGCAASAPGSSGGRRLSATAALPLALGLSCSACHAAYACSTKAARSGGISAPALHAAMQVGCWLLSVLVFVFVEGGEFFWRFPDLRCIFLPGGNHLSACQIVGIATSMRNNFCITLKC